MNAEGRTKNEEDRGYDVVMGERGATTGGTIAAATVDAWARARRRAVRNWWLNIALAVGGAALFVYNFKTNEPTIWAMLLIIPVLSLRGAWKADRLIRACDARAKTHGSDGTRG